MSTTVNVRVDKSRLAQQLKDNSAATQQQAAQQAVDEAAAEQVRSQNEALRRRQQDANAKFRESRHDPIGRRDGSEVVLPNQLVDDQLTGPVILEDGALIRVARVGIRRNTSGTKIFVYPWGIEGALGRRLSQDYNTAVSEAFAVGVEVDVTVPSWTISTAVPASPAEQHPHAFVPVAEGRKYGNSVMPLLSSYSFKTYRRFSAGETEGEKWWLKGRGTLNLPGEVVQLLTGLGSVENFTSYDADTDPGSNSYTLYYYKDVVVPSTDPATSTQSISSHIFALPAGGDKCLVVIINRVLNNRQVLRLFYEYAGNEVIVAERNTNRATSVIYTGGYTGYDTLSDSLFVNEVKCVMVSGAIAVEVDPSQELIDSCNQLVPPITADSATGTANFRVQQSVRYGFGETNEPIPSQIYLGKEFNDHAYEYRDPDKSYVFWQSGYSVPIEYPNPSFGNEIVYADTQFPAFELANLPKGPYPDSPVDQQVLAKQLGIGYLETSDHSGKFFTPAIYEWLAGNAKLKTSYSEVASAFYQPGDENNPFVGVYLSVGNGTEDAIEMRATATQPTNITTAHTALDWVTINTASRYGDYLVWDWGNPEYCQQRLQALGMNV